ncbi:MAG: hypothetical protein ABF991_08475 [Liquorilactobacillus hordei]|uniref:hypothetical protein n=1 Tax=Liquorilactobacillus hordei TaxID=468911 RepID=UPI0039E9C3B3
MNYLFEFITMSFPKAGIQVGALPLTLNMLLFIVVFFMNLRFALESVKISYCFSVCYFLLVAFTLVSVLVNITNHTITAFNIASSFVVLMSPLAAVAIKRNDCDKSMKIMAISVLITGGYMIIQKLFGILDTALEGVTYTYGQDLIQKNIGYDVTDSSLSNKMPSTYQNGNSVGLFFALSIVLLLVWNPKTKIWKLLRQVCIVLAIYGVVLSGSRSIMFPLVIFGLGIIIGYYRKLPRIYRIRFLVTFLIFLLLSIFLILGKNPQLYQGLYDRYVIQTTADPTSNRGEQWSLALTYIYNLNFGDLLKFLILGVPNTLIGSDGMMGFLLNRGVVAQIMFLICLLMPIINLLKLKEVRIVGFGLLAVFCAFIIDSSYFYLPSLMNYFFAYNLAMKIYNSSNHSKGKGRAVIK